MEKRNRLWKALVEVVGEHRAHDVYDRLAQKLGGMHVVVVLDSRQAAMAMLRKELAESKMDGGERRELLGMLHRKKIYIPSEPYSDY